MKLEIGSVSPSYDKLTLISKGLDVELATLLTPKPKDPVRAGTPTGRRLVQRAGEGQSVETQSYR